MNNKRNQGFYWGFCRADFQESLTYMFFNQECTFPGAGCQLVYFEVIVEVSQLKAFSYLAVFGVLGVINHERLKQTDIPHTQ